MKVLLIEDDFSTARSIQLALQVSSIECTIAYNGQDGIDLAYKKEHDLILLDLILPDVHGSQVIKQLRQEKIEIPILVLSGVSNIDEKIKMLQLGADDYLTKPFNNTELVARMKAIVKRAQKIIKSQIKLGKLTIDFDSHIVTLLGEPVKLTDKEYGIIELLVLKRNQFVNKEALMLHLYGNATSTPLKVINVFVCRVRKKLEKISGGLNFIQTVWGSGYKLIEDGDAGTLSGKEKKETVKALEEL